MKYEEDIILFIDKGLIGELQKCVETATPNEACGLIFGKIDELKKNNRENQYSYYYNCYKFECIESTNKSPIAFLMDDYQKLIDISNKYSEDFQLISIFHSHPANPYPSGIDIPYMKNYYKSGINKFKHIIWTIMDAKYKMLNGFIFLFDELKQILVQIKE